MTFLGELAENMNNYVGGASYVFEAGYGDIHISYTEDDVGIRWT